MNYQELRELVGGSNPKSATYADIISGIQSQYRPQTQFAPTKSLLDSMGTLVADQPRIAYGSLLQAQPRKLPEKFDITKYLTTTDGVTDVTGGGDGAATDSTSTTSGNTGFTIGENGQAVPTIGNFGLATLASIVTGMPIGLMNSLSNALNTSAANSFNSAVSDSVNESSGPVATTGVTGTGGVAAAASSAAASAVTAAGGSESSAGLAGQAAANAAISGMSLSDSIAIGIGVASTIGGEGVGGVTSGNGEGEGGGDGGISGFANGGMVTMGRLMGANPMGQDDGYGALQSGEYVIKKNAVDKYGENFLGLLNSGKLTKKQINSLL
jgi:hypothetical protein